jgi:plasmid stabilization system protein ParE
MKVVYRLAALHDLKQHRDYITQYDPGAAGRVAETIRLSISRLELFPMSGRAGAVAGTYELVVPGLPYIAVYRVHDGVEIVAIFHTSTDSPRS